MDNLDATWAVGWTELAAELGTTREVLRAWARRRGLVEKGGRKGAVVRLTEPQVVAVRASWVVAHPGAQPTTQPSNLTTDRVVAHPTVQPTTQPSDAGWRMALANMTEERDALRGERDAARDDAYAARLRAEQAELGLGVMRAALERREATWLRWYALVAGRSWWCRRRLPDPPSENAGPLLAKPEG